MKKPNLRVWAIVAVLTRGGIVVLAADASQAPPHRDTVRDFARDLATDGFVGSKLTLTYVLAHQVVSIAVQRLDPRDHEELADLWVPPSRPASKW